VNPVLDTTLMIAILPMGLSLRFPGHHPDVGGEVLEGMNAKDSTSLRDARISEDIGQSGRSGGQVSGSVAESRAAGTVSKPRRTRST
jgi:hypothetical protein